MKLLLSLRERLALFIAGGMKSWYWLIAVAVFLLLVAVCFGCDAQSAGPVIGSVSDVDGAPSEPASPAPPILYLTETTTGDTLNVQAFESVSVGRRDSLRVEIRVLLARSYAVMVGIEGGYCDRIKLAGISPEYATGSPRFAGFAVGRSLLPSDAFTAWFRDACGLVAFFYDIPQGQRRVFWILVEGAAPGEAEVRTQFEILGFEGPDNFRWTAFSGVTVAP